MNIPIEADTDRLLNKKVGKTNGGKVGVIYLPKALIGKKVTVIWDDKK